jgi:ethanolamine ammonia-lyase small subunit
MGATDMTSPSRPDPWTELRRHTFARIAIGRSGASLPTEELLRFGLAHAQARDAVHVPLDAARLCAELAAQGLESIEVHSQAGDRATYLRRPDLGRRLSEASRALLAEHAGQGCELACVIGDGLSSRAVQCNALALLCELRPLLAADTLGRPVVVAQQARVALADEIGELLRARAVLMLIGERPGLSSPDSLGVYFTWAPRAGRVDSERNCVSNIRPEGLGYAQAARKLAWLLDAARRLGASGVMLKDESDAALPGGASGPLLTDAPNP